MKCAHCGARFPENAKLCLFCGRPAPEAVTTTSSSALPIAPPEPPAEDSPSLDLSWGAFAKRESTEGAATTPSTTRSSSSKMTAALSPFALTEIPRAEKSLVEPLPTAEPKEQAVASSEVPEPKAETPVVAEMPVVSEPPPRRRDEKRRDTHIIEAAEPAEGIPRTWILATAALGLLFGGILYFFFLPKKASYPTAIPTAVIVSSEPASVAASSQAVVAETLPLEEPVVEEVGIESTANKKSRNPVAVSQKKTTLVKKVGKNGQVELVAVPSETVTPLASPTEGQVIDPNQPRFVNNGNGTVTDNRTGLMWAAKDSGRDLDWQSAISYCASFKAGGHGDWRMPSKGELQALYSAGIRGKSGAISLSSCCMWSSSSSDDKADFFHFINGRATSFVQTYSIGTRALPVRRAK